MAYRHARATDTRAHVDAAERGDHRRRREAPVERSTSEASSPRRRCAGAGRSRADPPTAPRMCAEGLRPRSGAPEARGFSAGVANRVLRTTKM